MHFLTATPGAALRGAARPAAVLLALTPLTGCSGQDATVPAPAPTAAVTVTASASPSSDIARTAVTLTAKEAGAEQLQQSVTQLRARAADLGLTDITTAVRDNTITVTAAGDARGKLTGLARPGRLSLRPVLASAPCLTGAPSAPAPTAAPSAQGAAPAASGTKAALRGPAAAPSAAAAAGTPSAYAVPGDTVGGDPTMPPELSAQYAALDCAQQSNRTDHRRLAATPAVACGAGAEQDTWYKFALGPVAVEGTDIAAAKAAFDEQQGGGWQVRLTFDAAGAKAFADITGKLATRPAPANQFAIVADGAVLSHPYASGAITDGSAVISGSFTREQAEQLASAASHQLPVDLVASDVTTVRSGTTP